MNCKSSYLSKMFLFCCFFFIPDFTFEYEFQQDEVERKTQQKRKTKIGFPCPIYSIQSMLSARRLFIFSCFFIASRTSKPNRTGNEFAFEHISTGNRRSVCLLAFTCTVQFDGSDSFVDWKFY